MGIYKFNRRTRRRRRTGKSPRILVTVVDGPLTVLTAAAAAAGDGDAQVVGSTRCPLTTRVGCTSGIDDNDDDDGFLGDVGSHSDNFDLGA